MFFLLLLTELTFYSTETDCERSRNQIFLCAVTLCKISALNITALCYTEWTRQRQHLHIRFTTFNNTLCILMSTKKQKNMQRWGPDLGSFHPQPHYSTATHIFVLLNSPLKTRTSNNWRTRWSFLHSKPSQHGK